MNKIIWSVYRKHYRECCNMKRDFRPQLDFDPLRSTFYRLTCFRQRIDKIKRALTREMPTGTDKAEATI